MAAYYTTYVTESSSEVLNEGESVFLSGRLNDKALITIKDNTLEYLHLQSNSRLD